jgi:PAS domain S-box-containing protein
MGENIREVFWVFDWPAQKVLYASAAYETVWGRSIQALYDRYEEWGESVHPDDRACAEASFAEAVETEGGKPREYRIVRPDGSVRWVSDRAYPVRDEAGRVLHVVGVAEDITAQKEAEEALQRINDELENRVKARTVELEAEIGRRQQIETRLRESEAQYRTVVDSAGDAIATVREDGVILYVNGTVASQFKVAAEAMIGKTMHDFFPAPFADGQVARIREAIRSGRGSNESHQAQAGEQLRWFNTTFEPLKLGDTNAVLVIARDIDDLMQAQRQLEGYREQMTRADRLASLGTMSAMVAHELTQPLTVLRLSVQNALEAIKTEAGGAVVAEDLAGTIDEIATMAEIIERFRGFARASSPGHERSIALSEVAGHVVKLTAEAAERAGVSVSVAGLEALPCLSARPKDMEQMFFALIMNAIQAADGGSERRVVVSGQARDHEIELCFADDCGGIAEGDLDQIFKPFFTTKGEAGGTGLGLCVVEHILGRYGAKIEALNRPGEGVTFKVTLPLPAAPNDY